jgi:hypothetical protein
MPDEPTKRKRQLIEFPEGWALGDPERETFRKYNPNASDEDIALQWEKFEAHHLSLGSRFKLWSQAWRTWALNQKIYGLRPSGDRTINGHICDADRIIGYSKRGMANLARHLGRGK